MTLGRRAFLTGLGGAAVALPMLEAMLPRRAWAAGGAPTRFVTMFGGIEQLHCVPSGAGAGYTMPAGLASLEAVRDHISIVTGLEIPAAGAGTPGPGGKTNPHHGNIMSPLLTGWRSTNENYGVPHTATADQLVAAAVGADTHYASLQYCAQPDGYRAGDAGIKTVISYGDGGTPRVAQASPRLAWESMFMNFQPTDPADLAAKQEVLARRLSVLDLVKARGDRLLGAVGSGDRMRLEQHFDQIRDLETRLADIPDTSGAGCAALPDPGADPAQTNHGNTEHGGTTGYSDEDRRASVFVDLIHMALVCDLTRVASLVINHEQSVMSLEPLFGVAYEMHDVTHRLPQRHHGVGPGHVVAGGLLRGAGPEAPRHTRADRRHDARRHRAGADQLRRSLGPRLEQSRDDDRRLAVDAAHGRAHRRARRRPPLQRVADGHACARRRPRLRRAPRPRRRDVGVTAVLPWDP
jgi:hypothetical protein